MPTVPNFDLAAAHEYFAAHCFNAAWDLIEKPGRTAAENRLMVALNQASLYHWQNRPDCTDEKLSVGYWQASRIHALLGDAPAATRHAEVCLGYSGSLAPFYVGYAYEALARAAALAGDRQKAAEYLSLAQAQAHEVTNEEDRNLLVNDLSTLKV
jgi:hypothetical protein